MRLLMPDFNTDRRDEAAQRRLCQTLVEEEANFFLKTVIPSRKATKGYLNQGETDAEN